MNLDRSLSESAIEFTQQITGSILVAADIFFVAFFIKRNMFKFVSGPSFILNISLKIKNVQYLIYLCTKFIHIHM